MTARILQKLLFLLLSPAFLSEHPSDLSVKNDKKSFFFPSSNPSLVHFRYTLRALLFQIESIQGRKNTSSVLVYQLVKLDTLSRIHAYKLTRTAKSGTFTSITYNSVESEKTENFSITRTNKNASHKLHNMKI